MSYEAHRTRQALSEENAPRREPEALEDSLEAISVPTRVSDADQGEEILKIATRWVAQGHRCALVTLIEIRGGAARPLGSQMVVNEAGSYCGFVSGGCTEAVLATEAVMAIERGQDRTVMLGRNSGILDVVLPCGGGITLSIHVLRDGAGVRQASMLLKRRQRVALHYNPAASTFDIADRGGRPTIETEGFTILYRPKPRLIISGDTAEARATAQIARIAGYDVRMLVTKKIRVSPLIDADTAIALLQHDLDQELDLLGAAVASPAFYIGALGSKRTHAKRVRALASLGFAVEDIGRIKAPIGIFGKARDTSSVALSVMADVAQARQRAV